MVSPTPHLRAASKKQKTYMTHPIAFITGISGQDGSYLSELLLSKGYVVHGIVRRSSSTHRHRLEGLFADNSVYGKTLHLHYADLDDVTTIRRLLVKIQPSEFYHLAGQSHVGASFEIPESTCEFTAMGTLRLLEVIRDLPAPPKFLHTSSSEIFGRPTAFPQTESTSIQPVSPYGVAKAFATQITEVYRKSFNLFACNAICYNHESPRRGESFVTRKISKGVAAIALGLQERLSLGNLDTRRDWGYAPEYVEGMWRMLQQSTPDDFILATGESCSLEEFLEAAFSSVNLNWQDHVYSDPRFMRPVEAANLVGSPAKAERELNWAPRTDAKSLAKLMVAHDMQAMKTSRHPVENAKGE
jgi:GDPmannose 4,6-dehydratase